MDRLASVGMLASKKTIYQMNEDGEPVSSETIKSPTSDFFFYCVQRTSEIMKEASKYLGEGFLFTWVDGIYFLEGDEAGKKTGRIYKEYFYDVHRLHSTFEVLKEFEVLSHPDHWSASYIKENKKKTINVPKIDNKLVNIITEHLLTKKYTDNGHS